MKNPLLLGRVRDLFPTKNFDATLEIIREVAPTADCHVEAQISSTRCLTICTKPSTGSG